MNLCDTLTLRDLTLDLSSARVRHIGPHIHASPLCLLRKGQNNLQKYDGGTGDKMKTAADQTQKPMKLQHEAHI